MESHRWLIVLCGLPGTGKTEASKKLARYLPWLKYISQNDIRREFGMKKMPKTQDAVLREIDCRAGEYLRNDMGVVFDSVNRYLFRRQQMYGVASCSKARVVTLEVVCPEKVAKKRIMCRPPGDGLVSDSNDPKVYDKLKSEWEDVMADFKRFGSNHVSYIRYDSFTNQIQRVLERRGTKGFISIIERILTKN